MVPVPAGGKGHVSLVSGQRQEERHRLAQMFARELGDVHLGRVAGRFQRDVAGKALFHGAQDRGDLSRVGFDVEAA